MIANQTTTAEVEIRELLDSWIEAHRTRDIDAILDAYYEDGTWYSQAPPLRYSSGTPEHREFLEGWFPGFQGPVQITVRDLEIHASGDLAYCHGLAQMSATTADGQSFAFWYRITLGLSKENGNWKIAHEHESVPFHMDGSFLAATDLQPE
jgi:uncharacterized protein (TIGR02246 family)